MILTKFKDFDFKVLTALFTLFSTIGVDTILQPTGIASTFTSNIVPFVATPLKGRFFVFSQ